LVAETPDEEDEETGTLLGVNGLASKPMSDVGFVELLLVVVVVVVAELLVVDETADVEAEDDDKVDEADEAAAAAAAAAAADPCSNCLSRAFWGNKKNY
jgi:hypothetical protein